MSLHEIHLAIEPLRQKLIEHPLYHELRSPQALRVFMEHHVFAVWDFMSLLKKLQQHLCPAAVPWMPRESSIAARLINEIVLGEETDEDGCGGYASHFDLYRRSMQDFGADTRTIDRFVTALAHSQELPAAFRAAEVSPPIEAFVRHTFAVIETNDPCRVAAAFTFGREALLPELFQKIVDELAATAGGNLDAFQYYLKRHIELDGDEHGPMAGRLVESLCGADAGGWDAAKQAAVEALETRLAFWDGIRLVVENLE
jgi:hypothetical protein